MPESVAADFKTAFEDVLLRAKTEILHKVIALRRQDITKLKADVVDIEKYMKKDINDYKLQVMTEEDKETAVERYLSNLSSRWSDQSTKIWTKARCDRFIKVKKKNDANEERVSMDIEPSNDNGGQVQSLQRTVNQLQQSIKTLEKKISAPPAPANNPPNPPNNQSKDKSKDKSKDNGKKGKNGKNKDKDGKEGNKNTGGGSGKGKGGKGRAAGQK